MPAGTLTTSLALERQQRCCTGCVIASTAPPCSSAPLRGKALINDLAAPLLSGDQNRALHPPGMCSTTALHGQACFAAASPWGRETLGDVGAPGCGLAPKRRPRPRQDLGRQLVLTLPSVFHPHWHSWLRIELLSGLVQGGCSKCRRLPSHLTGARGELGG